MSNFYDTYIIIFFIFLILVGVFIYHNTEEFYAIFMLFLCYFLFSLTYLQLFYDIYNYNRLNFSEYFWCICTWVCMFISYSIVCDFLKYIWDKPFLKKSDISLAFIYFLIMYVFSFFLKNIRIFYIFLCNQHLKIKIFFLHFFWNKFIPFCFDVVYAFNIFSFDLLGLTKFRSELKKFKKFFSYRSYFTISIISVLICLCFNNIFIKMLLNTLLIGMLLLIPLKLKFSQNFFFVFFFKKFF